MSKDSYAQTLTGWEELLAAIEANKSDLSPVDPYSVQLEAELSDLKAALARRSALRAELLQTTKNIRCYVALGKDLTIRIRGWIRSQYGHRSEKLAEFGIKPHRKRRPPRARPVSEAPEQGAPWSPTSR
jgi:hypothetical protein